MTLSLRRAPRPPRGSGKVHLLNDIGMTLCRPSLQTRGADFDGYREEITCPTCLDKLDAPARRERERVENEQRHRERLEWYRARWRAYNEYLRSETWRAKQELVMDLVGGRCQGLGCKQRAVHVHHKQYPEGCWPGSREWIDAETLDTLQALCRDCHSRTHGWNIGATS